MAPAQSGSSCTDSRWNLEMLVFVEVGIPENPEKNPQSKGENQQQIQHTYDTGTRATLVGGECSHHCAIPDPETNKTKNDRGFRHSEKVSIIDYYFVRVFYTPAHRQV